MSTVLIVGHPDLAASRTNAALCASTAGLRNVDVRVLATLYPDGRPDVHIEQAALVTADDIVLLYPTYWYSIPALLKRWLDEVLARGWAYGTGQPGALAGKSLRVVTTTGGAEEGYRAGALHSFEYDAILAALKATAHRLGMSWLEPLVIHGVRDLDGSQLLAATALFRSSLAAVPTRLPGRAANTGSSTQYEATSQANHPNAWRPRSERSYSSHVAAERYAHDARRRTSAGSRMSK